MEHLAICKLLVTLMKFRFQYSDCSILCFFFLLPFDLAKPL